MILIREPAQEFWIHTIDVINHVILYFTSRGNPSPKVVPSLYLTDTFAVGADLRSDPGWRCAIPGSQVLAHIRVGAFPNKARRALNMPHVYPQVVVASCR